jgi:integrase
MAKARLHLRKASNANKVCPIYLVIEHQSKELLKYPTNIKILAKHWNNEKKEVRKVSDIPYETYNSTLQGFIKEANRIFAELNAEHLPITGEAVRKNLDIFTNKVKVFDGSFLGFMDLEIEKIPNRINTTTGRKYSKQTLSKYKCLYKVIAEMEKKTKRSLTFEKIDMDFYYSFIEVLQIKGFQPNTIGSKYITPLKTILSEAESVGIKVNPIFRKRFKAPSEEPFKIYLNSNEISNLENLNLSKNERLERVRDIFLLGYYTGQRWGDYSKYEKAMFEDNTIKLMQNKGAKRVTIPIDEKVLHIMQKYDWELPKISQQKFNDYLKEVCKMANIKDLVSRTFNFGGVKEIRNYEKWELVSSHTARRSYATNTYLANNSSILNIMKITGHATEKDFRKYICFTDEENANIMRNLMEGKKQPSPLAKVG